MEISFLEPVINEEDIQATVDVLRSGWITRGKNCEAFEESFANYIGAKHAIINSSGTAALHVSLMAAGVGPGDEVITSALSYVATSNAILYVDAKPVFVDVEPETGLIDVSQVESAITPKTRAIIPVHLYGQMVDMLALKKIADQHNLKIIEDACESIEAIRDGIKPGELSFSACFSFHAAKNISCGEGGAVTVNDSEVAEKIRLHSDAGVKKANGERHMIDFGYKYSITDFQAAMLLNQMKRIDEMWEKRRAVYSRYAEALKNSNINFVKEVPNSKNACHMFPIWGVVGDRLAFRKKLAAEGVHTSVHFDPIPLEPYYKKRFDFTEGMFPIAEKIGLTEVTLPLYPQLTKEQKDYVIEKLKKVVSNHS
jgi:dTDP-4-amino-4,6-dideoxygalactose transaminase